MIKNKLFIDCQFFQTPAWDRGMGRYTMSLLKTLYSMSKDAEYVMIFSSHLPQDPEMMQAVRAVVPDAEILSLQLLSTAKHSYAQAAEHNKEVLNGYLSKLNDDGSRRMFMIPCLFQEPTASVFPDGVEKTLLYYDAIPLLYFQRYRGAIKYDNYLERHRSLFEADKIFTISQTIADDLAIYYGMKTDNVHVINIDGACIEGMFDTFKKPEITLPKKYILFPTSDDIRKNNKLAIQAFDQLRTLTGTDYKLIVTSRFDESRRKALEAISKNVIFTGNVSDAELAWLYKHAEVVLFTSEYEGLGLPVLEAVRMGKKVACSSIPVFREISEEAFYFFDPLDASDITHKLYKALHGDGWAEKEKLYKHINKRYTWERSAELVHTALSSPFEPRVAAGKKPKLAVLAPVPDGYSAIGKVVQELHTVTARYFDVHYYLENRKENTPVSVRPNYLEFLAPCFPVEDFNAQVYRDYDYVLYHIGNSEYHFHTILNALHLPGVAVFHDTVLREAFGEMVRLGFMHEPRLWAEAKLDELMDTQKTAFMTSIANNQLAGMAHSDYAKKAIQAVISQKVTIHRGELPTALPAQNVQSQHRERVHIGLAGILGGTKGLEIIKELAMDETLAERAILHVFGFSIVEPDAIEEIKEFKNVRLTTNLSDLEYQMHLGNLDVLVNYRTQYRGETSLTVLEAMRYGCVAIVNGGLGWFSELPDETVVKVKDHTGLLEAVRSLAEDRDLRAKIGTAAKAYIGASHDPDAYIAHLAHILSSPKHTPNGARAEAIKESGNAAEVLEQYKRIEKTEE
jgi:glycosyltransferase involved in cell wall biosynthesis